MRLHSIQQSPAYTITVFQRSIELEPKGDAGRYMYMGQMTEGSDALKWFEAGLGQFRAERTALESSSGSREELQQQWVAATQVLLLWS